ncbi:MAG: SNF2-related protein, partial [Rivularia sp. ALOHA_DT_140]|nr:SNF2-related protein [Rivularia sp. ALOHA_DT_140]
NFISRQSNHWLRYTYSVLETLLQVQQGDIAQKELILSNNIPTLGQHHSLEKFFSALCFYWTDKNEAKKYLPSILEPILNQAVASEYHWLTMETAEILSRLKPDSSYETQAKILQKNTGIKSIVDLIHSQEPWELCLNALVNIYRSPQETSKPASEKRLAWFITFYNSKYVLQAREQVINGKGDWSKGRTIAFRRLKENLGEFNYLTTQDIKVCNCIENFTSYNRGHYSRKDYTLNEKAISVLIGHPLVFWEDSPTTRVEIVKGEPELIVKKGKAGSLILKFLPHIEDTNDVIVVKETSTRIKVIEINSEHRRIADILGEKNRLEVPDTAQEKVLAAINTVSTMVTVHSDIGGGLENAEEVPANNIPHIHLLPAGAGLKVAILSRPFTDGDFYYPTGKGGATVFAEIYGKRLQTTRNLKQEKQLKKEIIAACPTLTHYQPQDGEWLIDEVEDCLELLLELQQLGDKVILEWPEGEKFRVSHNADLSDFELQIERQRDWFAVDGNLNLDENLVLDMQQLLELLQQSSSRFVRLKDGQFLALTRKFRQRLDELRAFTQRNGKGMGFHPASVLAMEDLIDGVGELKADKHWRANIQRLQEMKNLQPELPSTLQAELRDYQIEGFNWLSRLAYWGVGACLADQMGLGKTLQALALILQRAVQGATLIIAPTSVSMNWISEAGKFAPRLNVIQFGSGNRQKLLDKLQPLDMLVCSYGLLQQEEVAQMLSQVEWQTIVLDEAQAIKNIATKRSQAAMNLQSEFKLITTGTPVENHLGELWNLFRFINPGLLGSKESFNQSFAVPIEKFQDKQARQRLKKLIQPFLLRRTKTQVLSELPSRTEITLHVELSQEEMAMYEALRQQAITKLADSDATAGHKHLQVLAEIMKLRRACCHSKLVMP